MLKWVIKEELEITHVKGSGPGGQNRNKRMSGIRIVHIPTGISVLATERRSQGQNLQAALERLDERLAIHYYVPEKRVASKPTKGSKRRRAKNKESRSDTKKFRQKIRGFSSD